MPRLADIYIFPGLRVDGSSKLSQVADEMPHSDDTSSTRSAGPDDRSQVRGCVRLLLERFPHVQAVSLQLLEQHEAFRDLCEEYEACTEAAERLAHSEADEALRREYSALRLRLEGELLRYISEHGRSNGAR